MLTKMACLALTATLLLANCSPNNLYVAHDVVVGVNAKLSTDRQQGTLVIGYDRDFITIIPKSVKKENGGKDVMSLLGCTELTVDGIFISSFVDTLASGEVAKKFAAKLAEDDRFFDCHDGQGKTKSNGGGDGS